MRKALILTVLALFGSEALAQKSFRHAPTASLDDAQDNTLFMAGPDGRGCTHPPSRIGSGGFGSSRLGRFDDAQDNEMALDLSPYPAGMNRVVQNVIRESERRINNDYRVKVGRWDDSQDNEMALDLSQSTINKAVRDTIRLANNDYRVKVGRFDDFEDDTLFTQADLGRMSSPFLSGSGLVGGGGSARGGGVAMGGTGQMNFNIAKNTQLITGLSASHAPGSRVNLAPHVGVNFKFDDQDDEFFAEDDELFTQGDMGRMSGFLGNGGSGLVAGGGSARGGGVAWGGAGQYAHNIGKNTQLIGGASFSHAPGSRVGINPHVGVKFSFDDEEQN